MLHIILLILKIIGWILLAILGIIVLLLLVTLFVPVRYRGEASCKGALDSLYGKLKFSWLAHLVSGYAVYEEGKLNWAVRIAWKKMSIDGESSSKNAEDFPYEAENTVDCADRPKVEEQKADSCNSEVSGLEAESVKDKRIGLFQKIRGLFAKVFSKTNTFYKKLKYTFNKFCDTIKSLLEKKDKLGEFITDEVHRSAFFAVLAEIKRLLRYLKPKKLQADIHFGFENPAITGNVLAVISIVYPFIEAHAVIRPDFEQSILEGNLLIAGKVRTHYAAVILWNLIWNKNVRTTFRHIWKFSL